LCFLIYVCGQQILRQSANDPQIQMAEDSAEFLKNNIGNIGSEMGGPIVDLRTSLQTFYMDFDDQGILIRTNLNLEQISHENNTQVTIPKGVLEYARKHGQDALTWQPLPEVRIAAVVVHYSGKNSGFILVGRSLREVEERTE